MILRCLVADDEVLARDLMARYIKKIPYLQIVSVCEDGEQALQALSEQTIDIAFLDVEMPEMSGIEVLQHIKKPPTIILTTAYAGFALESYEFGIVDYLLKPFSYERFLEAVHKALKNKLFVSQNTIQSFVMVRVDRKLVKVNWAEIVYIEAAGDYIVLHTPTAQILSNDTLREMEEKLPVQQFVRIHKSYIIHIEFLKMIDSGGMIELKGVKNLLPLSATYKNLLYRVLGVD